MSRFFLTTAIDFVNSRPHLGTAYEKIAADVIARYKRLCGVETRFLMGADEHSQNVFKKASEEGLDPLAYCDRMEHEFRRTWKRLDVSFDDFIRTTEPRHESGVTMLTKKIHDAGDIYEGVYEGWYCVGCEAFKQEKDLVDGKCPLHLTQPQWIREKNFFFRLSKYQQPILDHFSRHPEFLQPDERRNEILRLLESGLDDISVSRAGQAWGIPLPFDAGSVVYVWFDALINYASAVGLGRDPALFAKWWPADLHIIGKDITRFHTVIWPAMLMSARLPLPRQVFGHGFMTVNGQRMSKSLGTAIDPVEAADRFGPDPLRLFLTKEIAFGADGDFSWERYDERYNTDLANNLGNLVSRVTTMAHRYREGRVAPATGPSDQLVRLAEQVVNDYRRSMDALELHEGAAAAYRLVDATNEFIAATSPWALAKDPSSAGRLSQVLFDSAEAIRLAAVLLSPFMPASTGEILRRVGAPSDTLHFDRDGHWRAEGERTLALAGPLWPRKEPTTVTDTHTPGAAPGATPPDTAPGTGPGPAAPAAAASARISIDDFMKVELRVARVLAAERVPKSKKLLKLSVDVGSEQRTLVAGLADAYEPDTLVGRSVVIVFNLQPATLMGVESNGMVLAASPEGGKPMLLSFEEPPPPGTRVR
ncbi:MAG TPA: methionine--tRNA ligase [Vicinamibacterales bacterium]|nr:methionine--tRNA ligase [Vicinamibacterales bacterium]